MKGTTDFGRSITRFLSEYLPHERNVSGNTIMSYRDTFVQLLEFMRDRKDVPVDRFTLSSLTRENVSEFLLWTMEVRHCGAVTRNCRLAAICSFVRYLQYNEITQMAEWQRILSISALKTERKTFPHITLEGVRLLLSQPDTGTHLGRKHLTMLSLMFETGARVQEVADLTVESLRISSPPYTVRIVGKGKKHRIVTLMDDMVEILRGYLEENHLMEPKFLQSPLFPNRAGHKMTRQGISYILDTYAAMSHKVNPDLMPGKISPHCLRHSRAMSLLQAGVDIVYIRDLLGHASVTTTELYARVNSKATSEALEKAYENVSPKATREWEKDKSTLDWLKSL